MKIYKTYPSTKIIGVEHMILKIKHIFPNNCFLLSPCSFPLFIKTIAINNKTIKSSINTMLKNQNKIMLGAFSINDTSHYLLNSTTITSGRLLNRIGIILFPIPRLTTIFVPSSANTPASYFGKNP